MNLELQPRGDVVVARVLDHRFVVGDAADFKRRVSESLEAGGKRVVLDLSEVSFMDSGAIGAVLGMAKSLPQPGDLRLAAVRDSVKTVLRLTRLDKVLSLYPDVEAAVASWGEA